MQNFKDTAVLCSPAGWFESYLVRNLEDRFSRLAAYIKLCLVYRLKILHEIDKKLSFHLFLSECIAFSVMYKGVEDLQ